MTLKKPLKKINKIIIVKITTQLSHYFLFNTKMTRPEIHCLKDMVLGVLKSKSVFVNQIAASLREPLKLKGTSKNSFTSKFSEPFKDNEKI